MDYKKLLCSVMLLGSFGTSTLVAYGEEKTDFTSIQESSSTINSSSSTVKTDDSISQEADSGLVNSDTTSSSNEQTESSSESGAVDEEEYDAQGNLQFHHPVRFEDFTLEPPAFRSARSAVNTQQAFINQIAPSAKTLASANNLYASVMIAQAIVESGWGSSTLSKAPNYNLFGIKGTYNGQSVTMKTQEWSEKEGWYWIDAKFRKYPSYKESLEDYAKLIKKGISGNADFYKATWKDQTESYKDATEHLQGRYATDKQYAEKLNAIIKAYDLTEFDHAKETKEKTPGPESTVAKAKFDVNDQIQSKLIASIINSPRIPQVMSTKHFVNLFRGESLIALAATALPTKKIQTETIPTASSIYVTLSSGFLAVIPPMK